MPNEQCSIGLYLYMKFNQKFFIKLLNICFTQLSLNNLLKFNKSLHEKQNPSCVISQTTEKNLMHIDVTLSPEMKS